MSLTKITFQNRTYNFVFVYPAVIRKSDLFSTITVITLIVKILCNRTHFFRINTLGKQLLVENLQCLVRKLLLYCELSQKF